jgi:hypothetical protein
MAAITSTGSGNWSSTTPDAPWPSGTVPVEGDTVTIAAAHTVTVDQNIVIGSDSGTALTINGILDVPYNIAADYTLTLKGNFGGSGEFKIGTSSNRLDSSRKFTTKINYSASLSANKYSFTVPSNGKLSWYGMTKTMNTTLTADSDANNSNKVISVAAATGWVAGDIIILADEQNRTLSQEHVIASVSGTDITLTHNIGTNQYIFASGDTSNDKITYTAHGLLTGDRIQFTDIGTITGISVDTDYYVIYDAANTFKVASSLSNALSSSAIDLTGTNSTIMKYRTYAYLASSVDVTANTITHNSHNLIVGDVIQFTALDTITGISTGTNYFVTAIGEHTFKVASTLVNAEAGTAIDLTGTNSTNAVTYVKGGKRSGEFVMNMSQNIVVENYSDAYRSNFNLNGTGTNQNTLSGVMFKCVGNSSSRNTFGTSTFSTASNINKISFYSANNTYFYGGNTWETINVYLDGGYGIEFVQNPPYQATTINIMQSASYGIRGDTNKNCVYIDNCNIYDNNHDAIYSGGINWYIKNLNIGANRYSGLSQFDGFIDNATIKYCSFYGVGVGTKGKIKNLTCFKNTFGDVASAGIEIENCSLSSSNPIVYLSGTGKPLRITNYNGTVGYNRTFLDNAYMESDSTIYRTAAASLKTYNNYATVPSYFELSGKARTFYVNTGKNLTVSFYVLKDIVSTGQAAVLRIARGTDNRGLRTDEIDILPSTSATKVVTFTGSSDKVNLNSHGFANGTKVYFGGGTLPTGLSTATTYYVVDADTNDFKVETSVGGGAVAFTGDGSGTTYVNTWESKSIVLSDSPGSSTTSAGFISLEIATTKGTSAWNLWIDDLTFTESTP